MLDNLFRKSRALLGVDAAAWQSQPHISQVDELGGDVATKSRGGHARLCQVCAAHPCFGCSSRTCGIFQWHICAKEFGELQIPAHPGDGINGRDRTSVTDTNSSGVGCLTQSVILFGGIPSALAKLLLVGRWFWH